MDSTFSIVEHPPLPQGSHLFALSRWADPKYFGAVGIPILRGHTFEGGKRLDAQPMPACEANPISWRIRLTGFATFL
jgi:hypothetical protein